MYFHFDLCSLYVIVKARCLNKLDFYHRKFSESLFTWCRLACFIGCKSCWAWLLELSKDSFSEVAFVFVGLEGMCIYTFNTMWLCTCLYWHCNVMLYLWILTLLNFNILLFDSNLHLNQMPKFQMDYLMKLSFYYNGLKSFKEIGLQFAWLFIYKVF